MATTRSADERLVPATWPLSVAPESGKPRHTDSGSRMRDQDSGAALRRIGWLARGVRPDEPVDAAEEGLADQCPVEETAGCHRAVAEHDEVLRGRLGLDFLDA